MAVCQPLHMSTTWSRIRVGEGSYGAADEEEDGQAAGTKHNRQFDVVALDRAQCAMDDFQYIVKI